MAWIEELDKFNNDFDNYVDKTEYKKELEREELVNSARSEIDGVYQDIVEILNGHVYCKNKKVNKEFVADVNKLIDEYTV